MEWNDDWRDKIPSDMQERLAEGRNKATDVIVMATEMHKCNPDMTAERCFMRMIEWVSANSQYKVVDTILNSYAWYLARVK